MQSRAPHLSVYFPLLQTHVLPDQREQGEKKKEKTSGINQTPINNGRASPLHLR